MAPGPSQPLLPGLRLGVYRAAQLTLPVALAQQAVALGYHSVWSAEAYGADALSPLAYLARDPPDQAGHCCGAGGCPAPTGLAMAALTIDALAGGVLDVFGQSR